MSRNGKAEDRMKLLVVEDEEAMAVFLRRGLTEQGFVVDLARDADEADEAVSTSQYDAIVLDGMIPGGDGFDLCRACEPLAWPRQSSSSPRETASRSECAVWSWAATTTW